MYLCLRYSSFIYRLQNRLGGRGGEERGATPLTCCVGWRSSGQGALIPWGKAYIRQVVHVLSDTEVGESTSLKGQKKALRSFKNFGCKLSSFSILGVFRQEILVAALDSHFFSK